MKYFIAFSADKFLFIHFQKIRVGLVDSNKLKIVILDRDHILYRIKRGFPFFGDLLGLFLGARAFSQLVPQCENSYADKDKGKRATDAAGNSSDHAARLGFPRPVF